MAESGVSSTYKILWSILSLFQQLTSTLYHLPEDLKYQSLVTPLSISYIDVQGMV